MQQSRETNHYTLLGLHPSASVIEIRRAYRELSKRYHPDTTDLPATVAIDKFQQINEAYATLSKPERRFNYDLKIGYSRFIAIQPPPDLNRPVSRSYDWGKSAYLNASNSASADLSVRPLSSGEIFVLFLLGLTFAACLVLAIAVGIMRGENTFQPLTQQSTSIEQQITQISPSNSQQSNFQ